MALAASMGVHVDERTVSLLERFEVLLRDRAVPAGFVASSDAGRIHERHILDCLRAVVAVADEDRLAIDIGSGAGLPGVVVAIAAPSLEVRLVESRRRRVAFLELAVEVLELRNASVVAGRIEDVRTEADLCFARAFAPLRRAWSIALPRLRPGGRLVYFGGAGADPPEGVPAATAVRVETPALESSGPLFIMTR